MPRPWPHEALPVRKLRRGDRVAIVSPSNGLAPLFPGVYERGLGTLRSLGLEPVEFETARMKTEDLYASPELRAADLMRAVNDTSIAGVIATIGGYESIRLFEHLNEARFAARPVFLMGGSDATTYLLFARRAGIVSFYGPSVMAGLSQCDDLPAEYRRHLEEFLFGEWTEYEYRPYPRFSHGYSGWSATGHGGITSLNDAPGWTVVQGSGIASGELWGGCIEVLEFLKSTRYWPPIGFFTGAVLFLETSEEKPPPERVGYMLRNYGVAGILSRVNAILLARPKDYTNAEVDKLHELVARIVGTEFDRPDLPILGNVDFGHTDPKLILPIGGRVAIDMGAKSIVLTRSPFTNGA